MSDKKYNLDTCGCGNDAENLTPQQTDNTPGLSALNYRVGTHSAFKESMLRSISRKRELDKLTSRSNDDLSVATMDAWATVLDVLTFYQERIINEGYLGTATERFSVLELARHIDYVPRPGVAADTHLAFMLNEAPGSPEKAVIPVGTKVQSIPEQDQLPQVFETIEEVEARVEWNNIPLQTERRRIPVYGDRTIYLKGTNTGLQKGDAVLMIGDERIGDKGNERWDFRKVVGVYPDSDKEITKVVWDKGLGKALRGRTILPAAKNFRFYALRSRLFLFGNNAPDWRSFSDEVRTRFKNPPTGDEWPGMSISALFGSSGNTIHLDGLNNKIIKDSWVVISTDTYAEVYKVSDAVESSMKNFTLTSKTTKLTLSGENLISEFNNHIRDAAVFGQCEELEIADEPVFDAIKDDKELTLSKVMPDLSPGKKIFITGKRMRIYISEDLAAKNLQFIVDDNPSKNRKLSVGEYLIVLEKPEQLPGKIVARKLQDKGGTIGKVTATNIQINPVPADKDDKETSELHEIELIRENLSPTVIRIKGEIFNLFDITTVSVRGNVAAATHGETRTEILGSGNGAEVFQKFHLKQKPLTYISAATPSGIESTLEVRVNDILWKEVSSFLGRGPREKIYTVSISDEGKVTIQFGDGITGARLNTGTENVKAIYRMGIGKEGLLHERQLSLLQSPPLGVNKVENPLATSGAEDPEKIDSARDNAPLTVLTLDRIVSVQDFEDFANAYAGISKAKAQLIWSGSDRIVYITVASEDGKPLGTASLTYQNLIKAIKSSGHTYKIIQVGDYVPKYFSVEAKIKVHPDYDFEKVKSEVEESLKQKYSFEAAVFGRQVTPSEVMAVIQHVEGVLYTDIDKLNGLDPFGTKYFRIPSLLARLETNTIKPAELLMINEKAISIKSV